VRLASAAGVLRTAIGRPVPPPEQPLVDAWLEPATRALGASSTAVWAEGAMLTVEAAVAEALAEGVFESEHRLRV
jgi:hypothetical protein